MIINMQLSALLSRCKLGLRLKWRPREENTVADALTNDDFSSVKLSDRIAIGYSDLPLSLLHKLWETQEQFNNMKEGAKMARSRSQPAKKRKFDKTPW